MNLYFIRTFPPLVAFWGNLVTLQPIKLSELESTLALFSLLFHPFYSSHQNVALLTLLSGLSMRYFQIFQVENGAK